MTNPVLVEVTRGPLVESRHRGAIAIVDADGRRVAAIGDVEQAVFPRSAVKLLQALPLVESGAADGFGLGDAELAVACSSHSGEPRHVEVVHAMLSRAGYTAAHLRCGGHPPINASAYATLLREGRSAGPIHDNCSGKHAGFLCLARHMGVDATGYTRPDHPVQRAVTAVLAEMTGAPLAQDVCATDGCSIPAYAMPLHRLAAAYARLSGGTQLPEPRARAARRLVRACMAEPHMVAGTGRFDTDAMSLFPGRLYVKAGAEGAYCAAFPQLNLGVALKCDDGARRAAETMLAAVIDAFLPMSASERESFAARLRPVVATRRGEKAGEISPVAELVESLREGAGIS